MGVDQQGNAVLGSLPGELAWSPSLLADAVNGLLGPGYVARSTVSDWLHHDRLPRDPLPTVVAHLISDTLTGRSPSTSCGPAGPHRPSCGCPPTPE